MTETISTSDNLAVSFFSELLAADQLARARVTAVLPKGMELSHFMVLNHLATGAERTPAQLSRSFSVTKGAMTNTIAKLEWQGFVHIRPDWDDARKKVVTISPAGLAARDRAFEAIGPVIADVINQVGPEKIQALLPALRAVRQKLSTPG